MVDPLADVIPPTAGIPWAAIGDSLLTTVKGQIEAKASGFLDTHKSVSTFLLSCTEQLAKAMFFYALATGDEKASREAEIDTLRLAMKEESLSVMVDIEHAAKPLILSILESVWEIGVPMAKAALKISTGI